MKPVRPPALHPKSIGILIPVYNEEATLAKIHAALAKSLSTLGIAEQRICFVDDGSTDASWAEIEKLCGRDPERTLGLRFRRNFGKADALQAGFSELDCEIVITMDADLQDDPKEIPAFLEKLEEGYDLVSGWKRVRRDPLHKTFPSRIFNALARAASGVQLHDFNCGFKAYRRDVTRNIRLFGEMHRFVPILANAEGFRIAEIPVEHHPREFGHSKYGSKRFLKGLLDLVTVTVLSRYLRRPAHVFGGAGFASGSIGFLILGWLSANKLFFGAEIGNRPLFFLGVLLLLLGTQLLSLGLIAEMIARLEPGDTRRHVIQAIGRRKS